jgi:hypothetical protein
VVVQLDRPMGVNPYEIIMTPLMVIIAQTHICSDIRLISIIYQLKAICYLLLFLPETLNTMSHNEVKDKHGNIINHGDYVVTNIRGGTHEGHVSKQQNPYEQPSTRRICA